MSERILQDEVMGERGQGPFIGKCSSVMTGPLLYLFCVTCLNGKERLTEGTIQFPQQVILIYHLKFSAIP